jgi:peptidoglycan-associated lipoprotein
MIGLVVAGCADKKKAPVAPVAVAPPPARVAPKDLPEAVARATEVNQGGGLTFSPDVMKMCPGVRPPKFGFDSSDLRAAWSDALSTLGTCLQTGGLKGRSLMLTGHTDPRGTEEYNTDLGTRRSEAVRDALSVFGVDSSRLFVLSRGESDAVGTDETTWAQDRHVDLDIQR